MNKAIMLFITLCFLGLLINQSNIILVLLIIEIIFLFLICNFLIGQESTLISSQIISLFILTSVAVKSAIGLAILIKFYKLKGSVYIKFNSSMKG